MPYLKPIRLCHTSRFPSHLTAPLKAALRHAAQIWEAARSSTWWAAAGAPVPIEPTCYVAATWKL